MRDFLRLSPWNEGFYIVMREKTVLSHSIFFLENIEIPATSWT